MIEARRLRGALAVLAFVALPGVAQAQRADSLETIRALLLQARYVDAEQAARRLFATIESAGGGDSLDAAHVIDALVESLWRGGKVRSGETRTLAERALAINEKLLGGAHPDLGASLANLATVLRLRGEYQAARPLLDRALAIQEQALGPSHPDVARTLTVSGALAADTGDLKAAQQLNERALSIRERALPPGDPAVAENLNALGVIRERMGDASGGRDHHERALAIREQAFGAEHPDVAASLNNLANISIDTGDYATARSLHERALAIREKALGPNHPDVAMSLNNLAIAVRDLGDHAAAWWLLERVLAIWERASGPEHPNVAFASHNLASLLIDLGDDVGTRLLAERARRARAGPREAALLAESLNAIAGTGPSLRGNEAARALLERALAIKEKAFGQFHPSVALTLTSLATINRKLGRTQDVRPLYERALAIREKVFGSGHPDVADTLDRLGEFLQEVGDYSSARSTYERVLAITENVHGPDHPHVGVVRQHLAEVLASSGDTANALAMALEAERVGREHLRVIGRTLPEREALMYAANRPVGLDIALTLLDAGQNDTAISRRSIWDSVIRSRAVVLDEMASRHRTVGDITNPEIDRLMDALASKREQLARLVVQGPAGSGERYRLELQRARNERDAAERALAERSLEFRQEQIERHFGFEDVRSALSPGSALVAFVRYERYAFGKHSAAERAGSYLAFIARPDAAADPAVISLGAAADVDAAVARWRKQMGAIAFTGGRGSASAEAAVRRAGVEVRAKVWDSLHPFLKGASRIFIVPDGSLHLVNWTALPVGSAGYLIEQAPLLHYLSAERDLARQDRSTEGRGLLVVDNPVFDSRPTRAASGSDKPPRQSESVVLRSAAPDCGDLGWLRFDALPGSAREAETIVAIWKQGQASIEPADAGAARFTGRSATEAALKERARGVRVLHLATHGFFLGGRCGSALAQPAEARKGDPSPNTGDAGNPLLLAGFALAGANARGAAGSAEDGVLTAEEVAALNLRGVEWAVLSGCDTGVGEIRAGEGVFGLRRAFQVAGARTVIMSLWRVDDDSTRRWMTSVYEQRFVRRLGTAEAVRQASLDQLRRRRRAGTGTHPFYWAGFIAAGDWR